MKIAIRGGHSLDVRGASGIVDEVKEDRKITSKVVEYLKLLGHEVLDVTPGNSGSSSRDLSIPVAKANAWGADYFASFHLNATPGGYGTEVLYKSLKGKEYAERIVKELASLGFRNRGAKQDVRNLYEFNYVKAPNNIVECFFCDNQSDVDLYNKIGIETIAKAIVKGITGQTVQDAPKYPGTCTTRGAKGDIVKLIQSRLNALGFNCGAVDGSFGGMTYASVLAFQKVRGLTADGIVGPATWSTLFN